MYKLTVIWDFANLGKFDHIKPNENITSNHIKQLQLQFVFNYMITVFKSPTHIKQCIDSKPGGLDLSRRGLDRDSRSRHRKKVSLDDRDISIEIEIS